MKAYAPQLLRGRLHVLLTLAAAAVTVGASESPRVFRAGAHAMDVTPTNFPVIVNAMFEERSATHAHDPLHARCLVLDDGAIRIAIVVVDTCMLPREVCDAAKELATRTTGIPMERMLISATHTHSAPSAMGCLGSRADTNYQRFLVPKIAEGIERAAKNLAPARVGWTVVQDSEHTHCRRWIRRPDKMTSDPFGVRNVRANMHPGYQNPGAIGPSGPVDPDLSMLSVQSPDGRPIALLANYSMHYFGSPLLSADYYGLFAAKIGQLIGADGTATTPFVGIMSQGTSGDQAWMDYGAPEKKLSLEDYAQEVTQVAFVAYRKIQHRNWVPLDMRESRLTLNFRVPDEQRLARARQAVIDLADRLPLTQPEIYAWEQIYLHDRPTAELKLQALRIGELGLAAIPNEVYAISGLKIKAQSPLRPTFNIELANGSEGYIPPPEQHKLGGYTTWPARTAGLEVTAEPKIVDAVLDLLERVSGQPRRLLSEKHGPYAKAVMGSKPLAYWRFTEFNGPQAFDATSRGLRGAYEEGVAFYLPGPDSPKFSGQGAINRCAHFAGGRFKADAKGLGGKYTVEFWFWNGLPNEAREVTGYLCSRGADGVEGAPGDHLGLSGTQSNAPGRLIFFNGNKLNQWLMGSTVIDPRTWNYVAFVRDGRKVTVYLNGNRAPEISGKAEAGYSSGVTQIFLGGRSDNFANFEGKLDEAAIYNRALGAKECAGHFKEAMAADNR